MGKKGILVVSFGTTHLESLGKNITALEKAISKKYPEYIVRRSFTSNMIINALEKRGELVDDVTKALKKMVLEGVEEVYIQPSHIIPGEEYEKLCAHAAVFAEEFSVFKIGQPLLNTTESMLKVVNIIDKNIVRVEKQALVLMGHGTQHYVNTIYAAMDYMFKNKGFHNIFVGTVESYPSLEEVVAAVLKGGFEKVILAPLMLVAGDHALNDMAGEEDSWKTWFEEMGMEVRVVLKGLGEYPEIRNMYLQHMGKYLEI